jgi:hypothetical protein
MVLEPPFKVTSLTDDCLRLHLEGGASSRAQPVMFDSYLITHYRKTGRFSAAHIIFSSFNRSH